MLSPRQLAQDVLRGPDAGLLGDRAELGQRGAIAARDVGDVADGVHAGEAVDGEVRLYVDASAAAGGQPGSRRRSQPLTRRHPRRRSGWGCSSRRRARPGPRARTRRRSPVGSRHRAWSGACARTCGTCRRTRPARRLPRSTRKIRPGRWMAPSDASACVSSASAPATSTPVGRRRRRPRRGRRRGHARRRLPSAISSRRWSRSRSASATEYSGNAYSAAPGTPKYFGRAPGGDDEV